MGSSLAPGPSPHPSLLPEGGTGRSERQRERELLRRSSTVSFYIGLGVVAGFLVDVLVVARYGVGASTDAFFGAYTVPFILATRMSAVQPVLVSILSGYRADETAAGVVLNAVGLISIAVSALGALLARPLIALTTPGFAPATAAQAAVLARILFAEVPAVAVAEVCKAELYVRRRFGLATFSNALPSLVTIAVLLLAGRRSGIEVMAYGVVAGAMAQAALLMAVLFGALRAPYRWTLRHPTPILRQTGRLMLAPLGGLFVRQGVTVAERLLGSFLPAGSVTALSYANRLNTVIAGVFYDGVTTASLPSLADRWSRGASTDGDPSARGAARAELETLLKLMATIALPVGLAVAALSSPLIRLFFQRGQVDESSALLMGAVMGVYSLSLPALGPFRAVQNFFYAAKEVAPVVWLLSGLAAMTVALDLILIRPLGAIGLALAYALSCTVILGVSLVWLWRRVPDLRWRRLADYAWRLGLTSLAMGATLFATSRWLEPITASLGWRPEVGLLITLGVSGLLGLAAFVGVGSALRLEAISLLWAVLRRKA